METIDSAPMDGTEILGWSPDEFNIWRWTMGFWQCTGGYDMEDAAPPTHWAPLPDKPQS
jgi:hypothetical protein